MASDFRSRLAKMFLTCLNSHSNSCESVRFGKCVGMMLKAVIAHTENSTLCSKSVLTYLS